MMSNQKMMNHYSGKNTRLKLKYKMKNQKMINIEANLGTQTKR